MKKKIDWIIVFMVFKMTGSDSRFQRKNRFWKICIESQDINKKVSKIGVPNQTTEIWHFFVNISGLGAYFSKPIFALQPWVRAGHFEYHEHYNPINFFSLIKGSEPFCRPWERCSRKSEKIKIDNFQFTYPHRHSGGECCNFLAKKVNFGQP